MCARARARAYRGSYGKVRPVRHVRHASQVETVARRDVTATVCVPDAVPAEAIEDASDAPLFRRSDLGGEDAESVTGDLGNLNPASPGDEGSLVNGAGQLCVLGSRAA